MKFSVLRTKQRKEQKNLEKFLKKLTTLNPNGTFKPKENNSSHICSGLNSEELSSLSLPLGASFTMTPSITVIEYGFVLVNYKNHEYSIFLKGLEGSYWSEIL